MSGNASGSETAVTETADAAVVGRAAQRALRRHQEAYEDEVRRLLDAGLAVMRRFGTTKAPPVSDILEHAGMSRDAFYRHFASKEDLVAAIVEAGALRLVSYVRHGMDKESDPVGQLVRWVEGIMSQALDAGIAHTTRAVLWNGGRSPGAPGSASVDSVAVLSELLVSPLTAMGRADPRRDATAIGHTVVSSMNSHVWRGVIPSSADIDHLIGFCLAAIGVTDHPPSRPRRAR
jgi:AcrR family transcriptional regulator